MSTPTPDDHPAPDALPADYAERVYAGWIGKCVGVRFGAPIETWTYREIRDHIGPLDDYIDERPDKLFKPDDDTSLPLVLLRALDDARPLGDPTAELFARAWLDGLGDRHGTLWWGGYGISTEHTAYENLASGIPAPRSGSIEQNGVELAEQIGGQIFSDVWGLVFPDDPERAARVAEAASSVSHDGAGLHGARFIASMVSCAFVERDPLALIDAGLEQLPGDCDYRAVVQAVRAFHRSEPDDWHSCYRLLESEFGYDRYPGEVPIIPNAGVIVMALAYGGGDFSRTLAIANMAGWDTDCNVGNVGTILGTALGLDAIEERWRRPLGDLVIGASLSGSRNASTLPQCADLIVRLGHHFAGLPTSTRPRIHFDYRGSTNGARSHGTRGRIVALGQRERASVGSTLAASVRKLSKKGEVRIFFRTHYRPAELSSNYYGARFSPTLYPGQRVESGLVLPDDAPTTLRAALYVRDDHRDEMHRARAVPLTPGASTPLSFDIPRLDNACLSEVGVVLRNLDDRVWSAGSVHVTTLDWGGAPHYGCDFSLDREEGGVMNQWTRLRGYWRKHEGAYHGSGPGLCESYSGAPEWRDYALEVDLVPLVGDHHGISVRVRGALRSYLLALAPEGELIVAKKVAGSYRALARHPFPWTHGRRYTLRLEARGDALVAHAHGSELEATLHGRDREASYRQGGIGLSTLHGSHTHFASFRVEPVS